jgi:hypothetical protein
MNVYLVNIQLNGYGTYWYRKFYTLIETNYSHISFICATFQVKRSRNCVLLCKQERNIKSYVSYNFEFHIMLGSSWVAAKLAASQEGLSSMKLVS